MRVAVVGAGGVGGYFGGRLAESGVDVTLIVRGEHLCAIQRDGLRVDSIDGSFTVPRIAASDDPRSVGPVDAVIVAVKGWQLDAAASAMHPLLGDTTCIVPLLNGVDAADALARIHGARRVVGGTCRILSYVAGPGHIQHDAVAPTVTIGEMDGAESERVERLRALFGRARGLAVDVATDIRAALWRKFLLIAPWSGIGAMTGLPIDALRSRPETRAQLETAMREIAEVAAARGVHLPARAVADTLAFIDALAPGGTASMQRDVAAGRPSELETLTGAVVRMGTECSVPVPVNAAVYDALAPLERRARRAAGEEQE